MTAEEITRKRAQILSASTFALLFMGLVYAFSLFTAPLSSTFGLNESNVSLTFNIMIITSSLGGLVGSFLQSRIGLRGELSIAAILSFLGFAGTGTFGSAGLLAVYLLYGVCGGLGAGIAYNGIVANTNIWFPDKVGFSSGILMMGYGMSALLLGNLSVVLIGAIGFSPSFVLLGVAVFTITVGTSFVITRPPADLNEKMPSAQSTDVSSRIEDPVKPPQTLVFWLYWIWVIFVSAIGLATIGSAASDAQLAGFDSGQAALVVGAISVCNGLSRIISGNVYDRKGIVFAMLSGSLFALASTVLILLGLTLPASPLYLAGVVCCGLCYGSCPVISSAFARQRYGFKNYAFNLSVVNFSPILASLLNIAVGMSVASSSRISMFIVMGILSLITLCDLAPFAHCWKRDIHKLMRKKEQTTLHAT